LSIEKWENAQIFKMTTHCPKTFRGFHWAAFLLSISLIFREPCRGSR